MSMTPPTDMESLLRHAEAVRQLARRLVRDDDQADDVVQDACIAALDRPPPQGVPVRAWLVGIVRNLAARRRRTDARRAAREQTKARHRAPEEPYEILGRAETHRHLVKTVLQLEEPYRTALLLRYFDGLAPSEIAVRLGVPAATVSTHLRRGLARLRLKLDESHGGDRATWTLALVPLARMSTTARRASVPAASTSLAAGALFMSTKHIVAGAVAAILAASLFLQTTGPRHGGVGGPSSATAPEGEAILEGSSSKPQRDTSTTTPLDESALGPLDPDRDLHGLVVDSSGVPVAGARVLTFTRPWTRLRMYPERTHAEDVIGPETVSASDGTFRIRLASGAPVNLRALAAGFARTERFECTAGEHLELRLLPAVSVQVRAVDARGRPVAGASLRMWRQSEGGDGMADRRIVADAHGKGTFDRLAAGSWAMLAAEHPAWGAPQWQRVEFPLSGSAEVEIVLPEGRTIQGRVTDADTGAPIPNARVGLGWTLYKAVRTDETGRYELEGWTGAFYVDLYAIAPGYCGVSHRAPTKDSVDFELQRGARITGRVVSADGTPVVGAQLALACLDFNETRAGRTAADGTFTLEGIRRGTPHRFVVLASGHGRTLLDFDMPDAPDATVGDLTLATAHVLRGRVHHADGTPAARVPIVLTGANEDRNRLRGEQAAIDNRAGTSETRHSDDKGQFRFGDVAAGTYVIEARPPGGRNISLSAVVGEEQSPEPLLLTLLDSRKTRIRVIDDAGQPVVYAHLSAVAHDEYGITRMTNRQGWAEFHTDEPIASVEITPVWSNRHYLAPARTELRPDEQEITIEIVAARVIRGLVLDPAGEPVRQAVLAVFQDGRPLRQISTFSRNQIFSDFEGRFQVLVPLRSDQLESTEVVAHPFQSASGKILGGRLRNAAASRGKQVLQLRELNYDREIKVRAWTPEGAPAADVQVYARVGGHHVPGANVRTGADGTATLHGLPDEAVLLQARALPGSGYETRWADLQIYPVLAEGQEIELRFETAQIVTGRVVDNSGEPVAGAFVAVVSNRRPLASTKTDEEGLYRFRLSRKLPAPLHLQATLGTRFTLRRDIDVEASKPITLVLPDK